MGTVFLAEQEELERVVALKLVREDLRASEATAARFEREVHTLAKLRHPNVVTVLGTGREQGVRYLAMEYVEGRDLDTVLEHARAQGTPLATQTVARWGARLGRALAAARACGVIHRDVKPSNIRITNDNEPMLLDFGIAHEQGTAGLTLTGPFVGTPLYAAPEQIARSGGREADARADVYGLGATLYECLTGRPPRPGGTVEQVLHHALNEDPVPPRKLSPAISRDLEVVLLHALERDPRRRYESALALAEDLEALVEMRPIRARPPGRIRRTLDWARKHRGLATVAALLVTAALAGGGVMIAQERAASADRRRDAATALDEARTRADVFRNSWLPTASLEAKIGDTLRLVESHHLTAEDERTLRRYQTQVERLRRDRSAEFHEILALLRRAERLDPDLPDADRIRALLFVSRWEAHKAAKNPEAAYFREAARELDPEGLVRDTVLGQTRLSLTTDPLGAEVFLFRYRVHAEVVPDGARRLVPVAVGTDPAEVAPGTWCLRVTRGGGGLRTEDLVLEVDGETLDEENARSLVERAERGGASARVWCNDRISERTLPAGLGVRATAAPLVLRAGCRVGVTPLVDVDLAAGSYLALIRHTDRADTRLAFALGEADGVYSHGIHTRLPARGEVPPGFVRASGYGTSAKGTEPRTSRDAPPRHAFWIMEREVTAAEYATFLNDPATLAELDAADTPIRYPRATNNAESGGFWPRADDGRFVIPADWERDWPILGVSFDDAEAYARWRTGVAAEDGSDHVFALPTDPEWVTAGEGASDRGYPFGNFFWPRWTRSCFARPTPGPGPVLSFPVDESPYGAFDIAGSVAEWCDGGWGTSSTARRLCGSSWAQARRDLFKVTGGNGAEPHFAGGETGFRLAIRERDTAK